MYLRFAIYIVLLSGILRVSAQDPVYTHYDIASGLPGNVVYCAAQDETGLMWFGTDKGLSCFDGVRFHNYGVAEGLPDPEVLNLKLDSRGRLWISCFKRKPCYRYKGRLYTENNDSLLNSINLRSALIDIFEESGKGLWMIGYSDRVYYLDYQLGTAELQYWQPNVGAIQGLGRISGQLLGIEQGRITLMSEQKTISHIPFATKILRKKLEDCMITDRNIIVSIEDYTEIFEYSNGTLSALNKISSWGGRLFLDRSGSLWISSNRLGCVKFDQYKDKAGGQKIYLPDKKINQFFEDKDGGKWFLTSGEGIYYLPVHHATQFNSSSGTESNNITSLSHDERGIWFGDDESNIYKVSNGKLTHWTKISSPGLNRIRGIAGVGDKNIIGSDRAGFIASKTRADLILNSAATKYVLPLGGEQFCIGSSSKVLSISIRTGIFSILYGWRTTAATLDQSGRLWLGSIDGMYTTADSCSRNWAESFPELKSRIVAMANAGDLGIWVATSTDGLLLLSMNNAGIEKVTKINRFLSSPIDNIQSLFVDDAQRVWMATNNGVFCLDKQYNVLSYNRNNGISANDVNAVIMIKDTLWAATVAGLTKLPIKRNTNQPDFATLITICQYKYHNSDIHMNLLDSISAKPQLMLDPESSLIEIGFGGIDYSSAKNLRFKCLVKKCWLPLRWLTFDNLIVQFKQRFQEKPDTIESKTASLNFGVQLPAGQYDIIVFAENAAGRVSGQPATISIIKKPYWYQTIWVHLMIWAIVVFLIWRFSRLFGENRRLLMRVSELRLQAIKLQINPHFIGNSINAIQQFFFPPDFRKANAYIEIFTRLLRSTMEHAEDTFYPLEQEIIYLDDYLKMTNLRFGDQFTYNIEVDPSIPRTLPFPVMLLQPLVENATIHGLAHDKPSSLSIRFTREQERVVCTILDNGPGNGFVKPYRVAVVAVATHAPFDSRTQVFCQIQTR
ncbi:MAG TPA: hypothetical protein DCF33_05905 [Saprospirales bacterium]|nr:hypothetical protein [Saprospirales bacterium]